MNLSRIVNVAALLGSMLVCGVVSASTFNASQVLNVGDSEMFEFQVVPGAFPGVSGGHFSDTYNFELGQNVTGIVVELFEGPFFTGEIVNPELDFDLGEGPLAVSFTEPTTFVLDSGVYSALFTGSVAGTPFGDYRLKVTAVPLPAAFWMFGSALVGLFAFARRRRSEQCV